MGRGIKKAKPLLQTMDKTIDGLHMNEIYTFLFTSMYVQTFNRKVRGHCGLLHHKCSAGMPS